ncbi:hypothetical protein B0H21DRAFT_764597 [Amylocystis lapponica]|nr:hypothetical protein B0H21DRAFT_764597 [Amylocystis lapponica]
MQRRRVDGCCGALMLAVLPCSFSGTHSIHSTLRMVRLCYFIWVSWESPVRIDAALSGHEWPTTTRPLRADFWDWGVAT